MACITLWRHACGRWVSAVPGRDLMLCAMPVQLILWPKACPSSRLAWLAALLQRRPYSVAVAAVANKLARTIWAVLARGQAWRPEAWQAAH